jgi:hypothetical protein
MLEQDRITKANLKTAQVSGIKPNCANPSLEQQTKALGLFGEHINNDSIHFTIEAATAAFIAAQGRLQSLYAVLQTRLSKTIHYKKINFNNVGDIETIEYWDTVTKTTLLFRKTFSYNTDLDLTQVILRDMVQSLEVTKIFTYDVNKNLEAIAFS